MCLAAGVAGTPYDEEVPVVAQRRGGLAGNLRLLQFSRHLIDLRLDGCDVRAVIGERLELANQFAVADLVLLRLAGVADIQVGRMVAAHERPVDIRRRSWCPEVAEA